MPLLFILYCALFCLLITRLPFFTQAGISKRLLITLFMVRVLMLIMSACLNLYYLPVSDSVAFHKMGLEEYHLLFSNPHEYLINIYHNYSAEQYSRLLDDHKSFWNDLRSNLIAKMLSIFDIFSFKDFLINNLFFNFLIFFGNVALYKVFKKIFPHLFYPLIICFFLLPSALFFSSMIHRDGFILLSVSMIIYHLYFMMENNHYPWKKIMILLFFMFVIFLLRNFVFITLVPALVAWIIARKTGRTLITFMGIYALTTLFFFISGFISPRANLPQYVSLRQESFIKIGTLGNSTIDINPLQPTFKSFLQNAPQAFDHVLMRPYLSEMKKLEYFPFALEILAIEILFIVFLLFKKKKIIAEPVIYFGVFFSFTMLMVTGYTVPILGAIVRYRTIYLTFLLIPIVCYTNWERIAQLLNIKNKKM